MDLVPRPDQVVSAVGNVVHKAFRGGWADLRRMPRTLVAEGEQRALYLYHHDDPSAPGPATAGHGDPVLLVAPLAAPATAYDLRRGCSLVEHLVAAGRPTYLVEYGAVPLQDRATGIDRWGEELVPAAVREASAHAGDRPVHLVGWSLGGAFSVLAAAQPRLPPLPPLPIASVSVLGTPFDLSHVPLVAPPRPLLALEPPEALRPLVRAYRVLGGPSLPVLRWAVETLAAQRLVSRPLAVAAHLDDGDFLAQVEAVDAFTAGMTAYRGRTFGQVYHRFLGGRTIDLAGLTAPVLVVAGTEDAIAPIDAVRALVPMLGSAAEVRVEVVPGGHLGLLTGRAARRTTWPALDEWLDQWSQRTPAGGRTRPRGGDAGGDGPIGTNPRRRYESRSSRDLAAGRGR